MFILLIAKFACEFILNYKYILSQSSQLLCIMFFVTVFVVLDYESITYFVHVLLCFFVQVCDSTHRADYISKVQQVLDSVSLSIVKNESLDLVPTLTFVYGIVSKTIKSLKPT